MIELLQSWDKSIFLWLNSFHHPSFDQLMVALSGQWIWAPFILLFVWKAFTVFGKKRGKLFFLFLILTLIASDVTSSYLLKNLITRLRPCKVNELKSLIYFFGQKCGGRFGFVSSHAANSFGLIFYSITTMKLKYLWHLFWILPLVVSYSRIYLGVHYPGDILGGALVGLFWGFTFSTFFKLLRS